jgi:AraC family transcriptional activator of pobA
MRDYSDYLLTEGFRVYAVKNHKGTLQYGGRDTYRKIAFISGIGEIRYDDRVYKINGPVLLFTQPDIHCTWCLSDASRVGYVCAFKNDFLDTTFPGAAQEFDEYFFNNRVFILNSEQESLVRSIFCRMIGEQRENYAFKEELIQNQICILTHTAYRMKAAILDPAPSDCTSPIAAVFLELIGMEFLPAGQVLHFN